MCESGARLTSAQCYLEPLREQPKVPQQIVNEIFSNIEVIGKFNKELYQQLAKRLEGDKGDPNIGDIFLMLVRATRWCFVATLWPLLSAGAIVGQVRCDAG